MILLGSADSIVRADHQRNGELRPGPQKRERPPHIYLWPFAPQGRGKLPTKNLPFFHCTYNGFYVISPDVRRQGRHLRQFVDTFTYTLEVVVFRGREMFFLVFFLDYLISLTCRVDQFDQFLHPRRAAIFCSTFSNAYLFFLRHTCYHLSKITFICGKRYLFSAQNTILSIDIRGYKLDTPIRKEKMPVEIAVTQKLCWRLKELPAATGLTLPFWRKVVRLKKVRVRKVEGAIVILDSDLREFLKGRETGE